MGEELEVCDPNEHIEHRTHIKEMRVELAAMRMQVDELTASIKILIDIFRVSKGLLSVIKWAALVGSGAAIVAQFFKGGGHGN